MKDHCSAAVLPAEQELRLTDDLFVKDNSACADADKMTRPSLSYCLPGWTGTSSARTSWAGTSSPAAGWARG